MIASTPEHGVQSLPAIGESGLAGRALLGWMDREQAVKFLTEDCVFSTPLTAAVAEEIWESRKATVENLPPEQPAEVRKLALSAADLKAARKFRNRFPDAVSIVDFVRLNPMDLVVHQLWISTAISERYRDHVTPEKWLQTALLDPPSNSRVTSRREGDTIVFDLPHSEFFLAGPLQPPSLQANELRISESEGFISVALHANRALLLRGSHRTFACAKFVREAANAPHGLLFAVSNQLESIGSLAADVFRMMEGPRPPRMADFFDDRFFLPVTLRRRRYQMRIHCELTEIDDAEKEGRTAEPIPLAAAPVLPRATPPDSGANALRDFQRLLDDGMRHHRAGRIGDAVALYERALFLRPDSADVHNNLGNALIAQGRIDEAVTHCERALALSPGHVSAHNNLGAALSALGRLDEAVAHHERALALNSTHAEGYNELGNTLLSQGRFDEAIAQYGRAIAIRPDYAEAHFNRADVKSFHPGDPDLAALEALAGRDDLSPDWAPHIHFALAKALDDCGDYPRAFTNLRKGNEAKRRQIEYDEPRVDKLFQRLSTVFDRGLFDRLQGNGDPSRAPIFVLGMPRSGSTLIEQILAGHPQIHAAGELPHLPAVAHAVSNAAGQPVFWPEYVPALDGTALRRMGQSYLTRLPSPAGGKIRVVDKQPDNFLRIGLIRLILPNARIIHTMRDPMDTCVSCYSKLFGAGQYFSYDLAELGRYYRRYDTLMSHWRSVLPPDAMLDVSYEAVLDDLEGQARRLIDYCGLPWDEGCLSFHKTNRPVRTASAVQVRQPLFRSSLQRWRKYEASLAPLLHELRWR